MKLLGTLVQLFLGLFIAFAMASAIVIEYAWAVRIIWSWFLETPTNYVLSWRVAGGAVLLIQMLFELSHVSQPKPLLETKKQKLLRQMEFMYKVVIAPPCFLLVGWFMKFVV